jgi:hypothetical protein
MSYPARFQCSPVMLPSVKESLGTHMSELFSARVLDCIDSNAIAISSIPSSPPEILLSFQTDSTLVVVNHTLLPFRSQQGIHMPLFTAVRPGHRALLLGAGSNDPLPPSAPKHNLTRVWCTGGQVSRHIVKRFILHFE